MAAPTPEDKRVHSAWKRGYNGGESDERKFMLKQIGFLSGEEAREEMEDRLENLEKD